MEGQEELRQVHQASVLGACKLSARLVASCRGSTTPQPYRDRGCVVDPPLLLPLCPGSAALALRWGHMSLQHLKGQLSSGWRILFSSQFGGNFLVSQHVQGLPCHAQGPAKDQEMEQRLLLALSLLFHHPTITQTPQEALADRKAPGAGGSTALRGIFPHPRGCTSS